MDSLYITIIVLLAIALYRWWWWRVKAIDATLLYDNAYEWWQCWREVGEKEFAAKNAAIAQARQWKAKHDYWKQNAIHLMAKGSMSITRAEDALRREIWQ